MEFSEENQPNQLNQPLGDDIVLFMQDLWPNESKTSLENYLQRLERIGKFWLIEESTPDFAREIIAMCGPMAALLGYSPLRFVNIVIGIRFLFDGKIGSATKAALAVRSLLLSFLPSTEDESIDEIKSK